MQRPLTALHWDLHKIFSQDLTSKCKRPVYVYACLCVCVCGCVCVTVCAWTIWTDVKLLTVTFCFFSLELYFCQAGGSGRSFGTATNEDTHLIRWYRLGRQSAYLRQFSISHLWPPAKPRTGMSIFSIRFEHLNFHLMSLWTCTVFAICPGGNDLVYLKGTGQLPTHFFLRRLWRW